MRDDLIARARRPENPQDRQNQLREELHHLILQEADRKGVFRHMCFVGGTALRILYGLNRYSEDLDFSLTLHPSGLFRFEEAVVAIQKSLTSFGMDCAIKKPKSVGAVNSCFFAFPKILHDVHPQFHPGQLLMIKFEADMNPPAGAVEEVSPVTSPRLYKVRHFDLPSLFAGKLHAILTRAYTKGRDLYDFLWYAGRNTAVNAELLKNALQQTQKKEYQITPEALSGLLTERFNTIDFTQAKDDVAPFLRDSRELEMFEKGLFMSAAHKIQITGT